MKRTRKSQRHSLISIRPSLACPHMNASAACWKTSAQNISARLFPVLEKEGSMRRVKRGADGVVSSAKRFSRTDLVLLAVIDQIDVVRIDEIGHGPTVQVVLGHALFGKTFILGGLA